MDEVYELRKRHYPSISLYEWPEPILHRVKKTKTGRVTALWYYDISRKKLVKLFHDYYGLLPKTWKSIAFEKRYEFYTRYKNVKLDSYQIKEYKDLIRKYPYEISRKWIEEKFQEYFG